MDSIPQTVMRLVESLSDFKDWEENVLKLSQEIAQQMDSLVLRAIDDHLMEVRGDGLRLVGNLIASSIPFRVAVSIISQFISCSPTHGSVHRILGHTGREKSADEGEKRRVLFEDGKLPVVGTRKARKLMLEADGVAVSIEPLPGMCLTP